MIHVIAKFYSSSRDIIGAWVEVPGMGHFVKIVNRSITLLFLQEASSLVFEYARSMSATAISLKYSYLWWSDCGLCERYVCHIMPFDLFNVNFWLAHYALLFLTNSNICGLDSELPCKRNIESRRLLLTL